MNSKEHIDDINRPSERVTITAPIITSSQAEFTILTVSNDIKVDKDVIPETRKNTQN